MSRFFGPQKWAMSLILMLLACCVLPVTAKSVVAKLTEFESLLPFACPDYCGRWCDNCTFTDRTGFVNTTDDEEVFLPGDMTKPLPSGTVDTHPDEDLTARDVESYLESLNTTLLLLKSRQADKDIIDSDRLTYPHAWGAGPTDWWKKIRGLTKSQGQLFDYYSKSTAYVHHFDADEFGTPMGNPSSAAGGFPPVRGCTIFVAASDLGVVAGHFWENPTFVAVKRTGGSIEHDHERREAAYAVEVTKFIRDGYQFYEQNPMTPQHAAAPDSPPIADLVKPGMILDPATTAWRQFRLFLAYGSGGQPGTRIKNDRAIAQFRKDLAATLGIQEEDIVYHAPYYEPHDMGEDFNSNKPWFNTFTWQYAPAHPVNGVPKRALRTTFDGNEVADMTLTWDPANVDTSKLCRLQVKAYAYQTLEADWDHLQLDFRVFSPSGKELRSSRDEQYELGRTPADQIVIPPKDTGLDTPIYFWYTEDETDPWRRHPERRPSYDNWHINADFGKGQMYLYKGMATARGRNKMPMCRGGSWMKGTPEAIWHRTSSCLFECKAA